MSRGTDRNGLQNESRRRVSRSLGGQHRALGQPRREGHDRGNTLKSCARPSHPHARTTGTDEMAACWLAGLLGESVGAPRRRFRLRDMHGIMTVYDSGIILPICARRDERRVGWRAVQLTCSAGPAVAFPAVHWQVGAASAATPARRLAPGWIPPTLQAGLPLAAPDAAA
jgi:hypothetical protein